MTAPPWGHKPPAVRDHYTYWTDPPPALSPRVEYWLRRLTEGTWKPNKYFTREGYDCRAEWLGVYLWEYFNIIYPVLCDEPPLFECPDPVPELEQTITLWVR